MKILILFLFAGVLLFTSCSNEEKNPLLAEWDTPFQTPPFDKITSEHYLPAFDAAIEEHNAEIEKIVKNSAEPNFINTIEALDNSGILLDRVKRVFSAMNESMNNEKMTEIDKVVAPKLSEHDDDINLNVDLFKKVKAVFDKKDNLNLTVEQNKLLEKYYNQFVRGGANLAAEKKNEFREINSELSVLMVKFGENVLKETNKFELVIDNKDDLAGLPEGAIAGAAQTAKEKGYEGKWVFTIHKPSMIPFLQYSQKRDLREKIYYAYFNKGDNNDGFDNKKTLSRIAALRVKRAILLGYKTHAHFVLDEQMSKNPDNVFTLLNKLWPPALKRAKSELKEMQAIIKAEGNTFKLAPHDWWYYAEKLKVAKYNLDEEELRPYFKLENCVDGVFGLATSLWGITFKERKDIVKYHEDVKVFEVKEEDGTHIGILYTDYYPRASKRGGAWMEALRKQHKIDGKMVTPVIYNVGNFSKPTADKPSLISLDELETLFHEFGHALHGLLSNCTYRSISGTETPRDFVEFPSQVMENWCTHPDVIKSYAKHYKTGETIPDELVARIQKASLFNQGFQTVEYLAASLLDMEWHTLKTAEEVDVNKFENDAMKKYKLMSEIIPRYRSTYFNHIFSNTYSSGYYSYIWSEVLDADAFDAFVKSGNVLNKDLAGKYRRYVLASGGTEDAMELYKKFRGQEPTIKPLLAKRGLN